MGATKLDKDYKQRFGEIMSTAIAMLCRNGLRCKSKFSVEGLLGITLDDNDVFLVNVKETIDMTSCSDLKMDTTNVATEINQTEPFKVDQNTTPVPETESATSFVKDENENINNNVVMIAPDSMTGSNTTMMTTLAWTMQPGAPLSLYPYQTNQNAINSLPFPVTQEETCFVATDQATVYETQQQQQQTVLQCEATNDAAVITQTEVANTVSEFTTQLGSVTENCMQANELGCVVGIQPAQIVQCVPQDVTCDNAETNPLEGSGEAHTEDSTACLESGTVISPVEHHMETSGNMEQVSEDDSLDCVEIINAEANTAKPVVHFIDVCVEAENAENVTQSTGTMVWTRPQGSSDSHSKKRKLSLKDKRIEASNLSPEKKAKVEKSGNKEYVCTVCDKSFTRERNWQEHMLAHQGIYPYRCAVCQKGFRFRNELTGHMVKHTNSPQFPCDLCGKVFAYSQSWRAHMKEKHQVFNFK